ncbi:hypothetical protein NQ314_010256 [Rhamnusium bicolor]|uniref:DUF4806 domain-containing protein n=1 Tax=Rhamnusium bicolor TaxID=1586634 RepID=A0AAV8XTM5_9CUCU|nr:hypothetical protein NQ314_010256 [Rhamnusium bicolor]
MGFFKTFCKICCVNKTVYYYYFYIILQVRRLAALGGSGIEGVARRIMKYLMANQLGIQFNWKGRYNKVGFENTTTINIVLEAAKLNFPANEKNYMQVAWAIKEWLKHSAARINQANKNK